STTSIDGAVRPVLYPSARACGRPAGASTAREASRVARSARDSGRAAVRGITGPSCRIPTVDGAGLHTEMTDGSGAAEPRSARRGGSGLGGGAIPGGLGAAVGLAAALHLLAQLAREGEHEVLGGGAHGLHISEAALGELGEQLLDQHVRHGGA